MIKSQLFYSITCSALGLFMVFASTQNLLGEAPVAAPSTTPATQAATQAVGYLTPQDFLKSVTTDLVAVMTVEQAMTLCAFDPDSAKDKATAKLLAVNAIAQARLEKAVREKWGREGETTFAHTIGDNMPADAAKAMWEIKDDHASATFQVDGLTPMLLVKQNGLWKLDMAGYREILGENTDKFLQASTDTLRRLTHEMGKPEAFADVEEFSRHARAEIDNLGNEGDNKPIAP